MLIRDRHPCRKGLGAGPAEENVECHAGSSGYVLSIRVLPYWTDVAQTPAPTWLGPWEGVTSDQATLCSGG